MCIDRSFQAACCLESPSKQLGMLSSSCADKLPINTSVQQTTGTLSSLCGDNATIGVPRPPVQRVVSLKNRRLSALPAEVHDQAERVQELNLRRNRFGQQPRALGGLSRFKALNTLHLSSNGLTELPPSVCELTCLERLFLSENAIRELPEEVGRLVRLRVLRACQNRLHALPLTIGRCAMLESLLLGSVFGGNCLKSLPREIGSLVNLRELDLSFNQLEHLPDEIGNLRKLQTLSLYSNQLESLPSSIGNLTDLRNLNLANNCLRSLPAQIGLLSNLSVLNVRFNMLTHLPGELAWLKASTSLFISENPFCDARESPDAILEVGTDTASVVPSLRELCGLVVINSGLCDKVIDDLPDEIAGFLRSAKPCTSCRQPFFSQCHKKVEFSNMHGHARVPSIVNLCLSACARGCASSQKLQDGLSW